MLKMLFSIFMSIIESHVTLKAKDDFVWSHQVIIICIFLGFKNAIKSTYFLPLPTSVVC